MTKINCDVLHEGKENSGLCYEYKECNHIDNIRESYHLDHNEQEWEGEKHDQQRKQHQSIFRNKVILSILVTETAERIAYFGFRAVLVLYFNQGLEYSESTSFSLFASVTGLAYLSPLLGALLADNHWGRYNTIWRFGAVYSIGLSLVALGAYQLDFPFSSMESDSAVSESNLLVARSLSFTGLILVCLGTGGIKPCVSAFGADQVVLGSDHLPTHESEKETASSSVVIYSHVEKENRSELSSDDGNAFEETTPTAKTGLAMSADHCPVEQEDESVREFFNSFYFCINVGALLSFAIIPMIRASYGFSAAFFIPTVFMIGALGIFLSQRKAYKHRRRGPSEASLFQTLYVCSAIVCTKLCRKNRQYSCPAADSIGGQEPVSSAINASSCLEVGGPGGIVRTEGQSVEKLGSHSDQVLRDAEQVLHLMPLMLFFPVFWMLYDQQGSVWTLQATHLDRHGLEPEQSGFLNPLLIMIFIPLFDRVLYPWLEAKDFNIQPLRRMEYGMFLTAVAFFASTVLEYSIQNSPPNSISLAWQIPQITILTVAEILLNVTGLEFAYSQAPDSMQALILAVFLFMTAIGDGFGSVLFATVFRELRSTVTMITCALCMLVNLALFSRVARRWKPSQAIRQDHSHREKNIDEEGVELNVLRNEGGIS